MQKYWKSIYLQRIHIYSHRLREKNNIDLTLIAIMDMLKEQTQLADKEPDLAKTYTGPKERTIEKQIEKPADDNTQKDD